MHRLSSLRTLMVWQRCMMAQPCAHYSRKQPNVVTRVSTHRGLYSRSMAILSIGLVESLWLSRTRCSSTSHGSFLLQLANRLALESFWSRHTRFLQDSGTNAVGTAPLLHGQGGQLIASSHWVISMVRTSWATQPILLEFGTLQELFPTVLAPCRSGNAGLLRWPKLRAMCPLRGAFNTWAHLPLAAADPTGCIRERRPMPSECLSANLRLSI